MDKNYIIETKNLTKQYGSQKSVADLNISMSNWYHCRYFVFYRKRLRYFQKP